MEALLVRKLGDPTKPVNVGGEDSPLILSRSEPIPPLNSPTAVRVKIRATSLNFANYLQVMGKYQEKYPVPFIIGSDYSGIVESVGSEVSAFKIGDRVCGLASQGSFAELNVEDQSDLVPVPDGCDLIQAGALPIAFATSHVGLVHRAHLSHGQVLLVLGAGGGVGISAVQIGKVYGAIVIAVARGAEKIQLLKSIGVDHVVDSTQENVIQSVKEFLKSRKLTGVDVLYDPVGGQLAKDSLKILNWWAQILIIGFASGDVPLIPANIALVKNWTVHGVYWDSYRTRKHVFLEDSLKELLGWLAKGLISVPISHTFGLIEVAKFFLSLCLKSNGFLYALFSKSKLDRFQMLVCAEHQGSSLMKSYPVNLLNHFKDGLC